METAPSCTKVRKITTSLNKIDAAAQVTLTYFFCHLEKLRLFLVCNITASMSTENDIRETDTSLTSDWLGDEITSPCCKHICKHIPLSDEITGNGMTVILLGKKKKIRWKKEEGNMNDARFKENQEVKKIITSFFFRPVLPWNMLSHFPYTALYYYSLPPTWSQPLLFSSWWL